MRRRKSILIGNWKMNPVTVAEAKRIFSGIKRVAAGAKRVSVIVCPSDIHLYPIALLAAKGKVALGVQDVFWEDRGFFTGQVSPAQAFDAGARFAIVGHSERRRLGDTNEQVAQKLASVVRDGMTAVLCVGELDRDRDGSYLSFLKDEITRSLSRVTAPVIGRSVLLAYEPVWEIGRRDLQAMKPQDIHETSIFLKKVLHDAYGAEVAQSVPVLYGGSVSPANAGTIVRDGGVDGLLVGRESLDPKDFGLIIKKLDGR